MSDLSLDTAISQSLIDGTFIQRSNDVDGGLLTWVGIYRIGQDARIIDGPMKGRIANVSALDIKDRILIYLYFMRLSVKPALAVQVLVPLK